MNILLKTTPMANEEAKLTDALAGIVGHLRARPRPLGRQESLRASSDRLLEGIQDHLRFGEEAFLPALRRVEPGPAPRLEELEADHGLLHSCARELSVQIRDCDDERAYGLSRSLLAVLLQHFDREGKEARRIAGSLNVRGARRLRESLRSWRSPPPEPAAPRGSPEVTAPNG